MITIDQVLFKGRMPVPGFSIDYKQLYKYNIILSITVVSKHNDKIIE